jgi:hypothetical protein
MREPNPTEPSSPNFEGFSAECLWAREKNYTNNYYYRKQNDFFQKKNLIRKIRK